MHLIHMYLVCEHTECTYIAFVSFDTLYACRFSLCVQIRSLYETALYRSICSHLLRAASCRTAKLRKVLSKVVKTTIYCSVVACTQCRRASGSSTLITGRVCLMCAIAQLSFRSAQTQESTFMLPRFWTNDTVGCPCFRWICKHDDQVQQFTFLHENAE